MKTNFLFTIVLFLAVSMNAAAQNVGINATGGNPDGSAMLDVSSTTSGFLMPRMTTAEQNAITLPANGLTIYNTSLNTIMINTGSGISPVWTAIISGTISSSAPITYSGGTIGITQATTSTNGYLSSTDWNTFNNKADALTTWSTSGNSVTSVQKIGTITNYDFPFITNNTEQMRLSTTGRLGIGVVTPSATLHLKAGSTSAQGAPLKFNSGNLMTAPEAGAIEFLTDKLYFTTNTGARKEFTLNDATLTSGRVPYAFTNGRLVDNANMTYSGTRLSPNYITLGAGTAAANTSPLKFATGTLLTTPENGAVEFDGSHFYGTVGSTRYQLDQQITNAWSTTGNSGTSYATNFLGTTDDVSLRFKTNNLQRMIIDSLGSVGIGTSPSFMTGDDRELLLVDGGTNTLTNTLINAVGTNNDYLQMNVQNLSNGGFASSDIVATANNGSLSTVYIDMGINSNAYNNGTGNILNGANTAYLYATGNNFYIGNGAQNKDLVFFTNTSATGANGSERMRIDATGNVGITTSTPKSNLDVSGSVGHAITTTSGNITLNATHYTVIITGGTPTITLPAASGCARRIYVIVNQTATGITISSYKSFAAGVASTTVGAASSITVQSDGSNWYRIQ